MKLVIEDWLKEQGFNKDVSDLFDESLICYKAGADRAAYIFSYLAFLNELKNRIQVANKPTSIPQGMWVNLNDNLKNEDKWESSLIDCLNNATNQVFPISEDLRNQVIYWKNRRNDCVHFKNIFVNASVVESFWSFLQTFLPKFAVDGSKASLLNEFKTFYDPSLTAPGQDVSPLVSKVPSSVEQSDLKDFLKEVLNQTNNQNYQFELIESLFSLNDDRVDEELIEYLIKDENRLGLVEYLRYNPSRVQIIKDHDTVIRNIWYDHLFKFNINDFDVASALLRNSLIPTNQKDQFFEMIFNKNDWSNNFPSDRELETLERNDFFSRIEKFLLDNSRITNMDNGNTYSRLIKYYILNSSLSKDVVVQINSSLTGSRYPYGLENRIDEIFLSNPDLKPEFKKILDDEGETYSPRLVKHFSDEEE